MEISTPETRFRTVFHICESKSLRLCELLRAHPTVSCARLVKTDLVLIESTLSTTAWMRYIQSCFLHRHVTRVYRVDGSVDDKTRITEMVVERNNESLVYRVQAYPKAMEEFAKESFPLTIELHPKNFTEVLHLVRITDRQIFYGFQPREEFYHQETPKVDSSLTICRAASKLEEIIERDMISIEKSFKALDIGASPGGWTNILSHHASMVVAVDPADLDPSVLKENVLHVPKKLEECTSELSTHGPFDVVVCDANREPTRFAQWLVLVCPFIQDGGKVVMTLKMQSIFKTNKSGTMTVDQKKLDSVIGLFEEILEDIQITWLFANTTHERTLVGRKKGLKSMNVD
eukprot:TRINITY_DN5119_c0_g1_i1.p1 TRINITY_DN5119_c0_g1~~TRINITY_DN5119_c0_g1_i1.p1  ORF type:complete len:346 (-),score=58.85 TRINITY_DN5119_c0_g1_i1:18-1055(-)